MVNKKLVHAIFSATGHHVIKWDLVNKTVENYGNYVLFTVQILLSTLYQDMTMR